MINAGVRAHLVGMKTHFLVQKAEPISKKRSSPFNVMAAMRGYLVGMDIDFPFLNESVRAHPVEV